MYAIGLQEEGKGGHHEKWQEGIAAYLGSEFVLIVQVRKGKGLGLGYLRRTEFVVIGFNGL